MSVSNVTVSGEETCPNELIPLETAATVNKSLLDPSCSKSMGGPQSSVTSSITSASPLSFWVCCRAVVFFLLRLTVSGEVTCPNEQLPSETGLTVNKSLLGSTSPKSTDGPKRRGVLSITSSPTTSFWACCHAVVFFLLRLTVTGEETCPNEEVPSETAAAVNKSLLGSSSPKSTDAPKLSGALSIIASPTTSFLACCCAVVFFLPFLTVSDEEICPNVEFPSETAAAVINSPSASSLPRSM